MAERMRQEQAQRAHDEQQKNLQQPDNQAKKNRMMKDCMEMMTKPKQELGQ